MTASSPSSGLAPNPASEATAASDSGNKTQSPSLKVVFMHLDWGIGGAEQLMLQLVRASVDNDHAVRLVTAHCDPSHCFAALKPETGAFWKHLVVYEPAWIPPELSNGRLRALCSTLRLLYLAVCVARNSDLAPHADLLVLDVLPTPMALLRILVPHLPILFYCHFPDQLLTQSHKQDQENQTTTTTTAETTRDAASSDAAPLSPPAVRKGLYRRVLDWMEESTMPLADTIVVNSQFTQTTVRNVFAASCRDRELPVLYPALDTTALDQYLQQTTTTALPFREQPLVSLNRYERKKNILLFLQALLWVHENHPALELPPIVIAGGYDPLNIENVEYRAELQTFVDTQCQAFRNKITFRQSISDTERSQLLSEALAVVYTPSQEHFGIVPVEAMYCGTPVVAVNSGGPMETVVHGQTGFLCAPTAAAFGHALAQLLQDPTKARALGQQAQAHVRATLAHPQRLRQEWDLLVQRTVARGRERQQQYQFTRSLVIVLLELLLAFVFVWCATEILRFLGVLQPSESVVSAARRYYTGMGAEL